MIVCAPTGRVVRSVRANVGKEWLAVAGNLEAGEEGGGEGVEGVDVVRELLE